MKAFQNLEEFTEDSKFSTWLIRITMNQSLMKLRKQRTPREVSWMRILRRIRMRLPLDVPDRAPNPEQPCCASELRAILVKALKELRRSLTVFVSEEKCLLSV